MTDKREILSTLRAEFNRWEKLLAGLSEAQITAPRCMTAHPSFRNGRTAMILKRLEAIRVGYFRLR